MTGRYLLDTNILSEFIRRPLGSVAERIRQVGVESVATSIVVAAELRFGVHKTPASRFAARVEETLQTLRVLALDHPADQAYARTRTALEAAGTPISANDMLIGAHALALDMILVTDNVREFARIPGLKVENWLR